jgi:hypothetical protein
MIIRDAIRLGTFSGDIFLAQNDHYAGAGLHQLATASMVLATASKKGRKGWLLATSSPLRVQGE